MAASIARLFGTFPQAIIGAMMLLVGIELVKFARDIRWGRDLVPMAVTVVVSVATNMAFGFLSGLVIHHLLQLFGPHRFDQSTCQDTSTMNQDSLDGGEDS